jgi:hypothetical protein
MKALFWLVTGAGLLAACAVPSSSPGTAGGSAYAAPPTSAPASTPTPATVSVVAFDGVYAGTTKPDPSNPGNCPPASEISFTIANGTASIQGTPSNRTGAVQPDGKIVISGEVLIRGRQVSNRITGSFGNGMFDGIAVYQLTAGDWDHVCKNVWHFPRSS